MKYLIILLIFTNNVFMQGWCGYDGFLKNKNSYFCTDTIFADNFDNDLSKWVNNDATDITIVSNARYGSGAVQCDFSSLNQGQSLAKTLTAPVNEVYVTFYLKIDDNFAIPSGSFILSEARGTVSSSTRIWQIIISNGPTLRLMEKFTSSYVTGEITLNKGQWYFIKIHYLASASGIYEIWINNILYGTDQRDTSSRTFGYFPVFLTSGVDSLTNGKILIDHVQITNTNHYEPPY